MTSRQRRTVTVLTALIIVGLVLIFTSGASKAVIPQDVVRPSWTPRPQQHETRPLFTNCVHARLAGADLPLTPQSPGWNPRLDHDHDGSACDA